MGFDEIMEQHYQIYPSKYFYYLFVLVHVHVIQGHSNFVTLVSAFGI